MQVNSMGAGFKNYINETVAALVPLTVEAYFDDVKFASIGALPYLVSAALQCTVSYYRIEYSRSTMLWLLLLLVLTLPLPTAFANCQSRSHGVC